MWTRPARRMEDRSRRGVRTPKILLPEATTSRQETGAREEARKLDGGSHEAPTENEPVQHRMRPRQKTCWPHQHKTRKNGQVRSETQRSKKEGLRFQHGSETKLCALDSPTPSAGTTPWTPLRRETAPVAGPQHRPAWLQNSVTLRTKLSC